MRRLASTAFLLAMLLAAPPAHAVAPVFDQTGGDFFDLPFPHELRRDPDGTVSTAGFPWPSNALVDQYRDAIEETRGFGIASGVFFTFDGPIDPASLPADPEASRQPGASAFLIDVDPHSRTQGTRIPLWIDFREAADGYRPGNLLTLMPVPGHVLEHDTLYAAVLTDGILDTTAAPVSVAPAIARLSAETPGDAFETAALPLYQTLWRQLEREGSSRSDVVTATVFRTGSPARALELAPRVLRRRPRPDTTPLVEVGTTARCRLVRGDLMLPQFQNGTPPFLNAPGTGAFVLDANGAPVEQREEPVGITLCIPQEPADGSLPMPGRGWPIVLYMHGTGGSRNSFLNEGIGDELAALGIATLSFDQPMHGPRPGVGDDFYNPTNPLSFRDNSRQAAIEGLLLDDLMGRLRFEASAFTLPASPGFVAPIRRVTFDRRRRAFFGHSQGATVGPLFLPFAKGLRGAVLSAGGGHLLLNIITRDTPLIAGLRAKDLVELLLGAPVDVFHPALHLNQMGGEVSDALAYVDRFAVNRRGKALSVLFTHGMLDPDVPTTLTASMVVAARYPLVAPTYPNRVFPDLPTYDYQEAVTLAGIPTLTTPVTGNLRRATGGLIMFELDGHFPAFDNPDARAQWVGFIDSLVHERVATIPPRP